jgi:hypothetical protein
VASGKTGPLVALSRLSPGRQAVFPLILPTEGAQDPTHVIGVIFHSKGPTNDCTNTTACPLIGSYVGSSGPLFENVEKILALFNR